MKRIGKISLLRRPSKRAVTARRGPEGPNFIRYRVINLVRGAGELGWPLVMDPERPHVSGEVYGVGRGQRHRREHRHPGKDRGDDDGGEVVPEPLVQSPERRAIGEAHDDDDERDVEEVVHAPGEHAGDGKSVV